MVEIKSEPYTITFGIIGAGRIGKLHADNLLSHVKGAKLKTVTDPFLDESWAASRNIPETGKDHRIMLDDPEIDAILIGSPSPEHAAQMIECARAGKHIFCEKPIALDPDIIRNALAEVEKSCVKLQVGFNRRFDPNFAAVQGQIASGALGEPHIIRITSRDPAPPPAEYVTSSGGLFMDMTIHDFDMARFLCGSEVTEVHAYGAVLVDPEIGKAGDIDTAVISLKFANGALGIIETAEKRSTVMISVLKCSVQKELQWRIIILQLQWSFSTNPELSGTNRSTFFWNATKTLLWQKCRPLSMRFVKINQPWFQERTDLFRS